VPKQKIPAIDLAISRRLKFARETLKLSQGVLAEGLGLSREAITNYEIGRVALPYDVALKICWGMVVSEKWLAEGEIKTERDFRFNGGRAVQGLLAEPVYRQIPRGTLFSDAWVQTLKPLFERNVKQGRGAPRFVFRAGDPPDVAIRFIEAYIAPMLDMMRTEDLENTDAKYSGSFRFVESLAAAAYKIQKTVRAEGLTDLEAEQLIESAITAGHFEKTDRGNQEKVRAFVEKHWRHYLTE
jgi:transcriptional regulator with XRE-family HTH domain